MFLSQIGPLITPLQLHAALKLDSKGSGGSIKLWNAPFTKIDIAFCLDDDLPTMEIQ